MALKKHKIEIWPTFSWTPLRDSARPQYFHPADLTSYEAADELGSAVAADEPAQQGQANSDWKHSMLHIGFDCSDGISLIVLGVMSALVPRRVAEMVDGLGAIVLSTCKCFWAVHQLIRSIRAATQH